MTTSCLSSARAIIPLEGSPYRLLRPLQATEQSRSLRVDVMCWNPLTQAEVLHMHMHTHFKHLTPTHPSMSSAYFSRRRFGPSNTHFGREEPQWQTGLLVLWNQKPGLETQRHRIKISKIFEVSLKGDAIERLEPIASRKHRDPQLVHAGFEPTGREVCLEREL